MITFKLAPHSVTPGIEIVEIWDRDEMIGVVYPTELGIKVVSKFIPDNLEGVIHIERHKPVPIPEILINIRQR